MKHPVFPLELSLPPYLRQRRPPVDFVKQLRAKTGLDDIYVLYDTFKKTWGVFHRGFIDGRWTMLVKIPASEPGNVDRIAGILNLGKEIKRDMQWYLDQNDKLEAEQRELEMEELRSKAKVWWGYEELRIPEATQYFFMRE